MKPEFAHLLRAADVVVALVQSGEIFAETERATARTCAAFDELELAAERCRNAVAADLLPTAVTQ
jgi:hypothetical protein